MLTMMLVAMMQATAPDGTDTARFGPMCWQVDAAPASAFSVYVKGEAQLFARDRHGWWVTGWDEGRSRLWSQWTRLVVGVPEGTWTLCVATLDGTVLWGPQLEQSMPGQHTNDLLRSDEINGVWSACFSSDPKGCR